MKHNSWMPPRGNSNQVEKAGASPLSEQIQEVVRQVISEAVFIHHPRQE
jgi:hypothetical protein